MKRRYLWGMWVCLLLAGSLSHASNVILRNGVPSLRQVFGGKSITLPLTILGSKGEVVHVRVQPFVLTSATKAPLRGPSDVLTEGKLNEKGNLDFDFTYPVPAVKRTSTLELQFFAKVVGTEEWLYSGEIGLKVYPDNLWEYLRHRSENFSLRLDDPEGKLTAFFTLQGIRYLDSRANSLSDFKEPSVLLKVLGQDESRKEGEEGNVIYLHERAVALPLVYLKEANDHTQVDVEMKLLENLDLDPEA